MHLKMRHKNNTKHHHNMYIIKEYGINKCMSPETMYSAQKSVMCVLVHENIECCNGQPHFHIIQMHKIATIVTPVLKAVLISESFVGVQMWSTELKFVYFCVCRRMFERCWREGPITFTGSCLKTNPYAWLSAPRLSHLLFLIFLVTHMDLT